MQENKATVEQRGAVGDSTPLVSSVVAAELMKTATLRASDFTSLGYNGLARVSGQLTSTGTPVLTFRLKLGDSVILALPVSLGANVSPVPFQVDFNYSVRSFEGSKVTFNADANYIGNDAGVDGVHATAVAALAGVEVDLTKLQEPLSVEAEWDTSDAANLLNATGGFIERFHAQRASPNS